MLEAARVYFYLFGVLAVAGGALGFAKARSMASLIAGSVSGILLLMAAYAMGNSRPLGCGLAGLISLALAGRFLPAFLKTRKLVPAGLMALFGAVGVAVAVLAWVV